MSPRPRTVSDEAVLRAAINIAAKNPAGWTLADVGNLAGLSPATIVQRFGSKRDLEIRMLDWLNRNDTVDMADLDALRSGSRLPEARYRNGLRAFRLIASVSRDAELRTLAGGAL